MWEVCARQMMLWNEHEMDEFFATISKIVENILSNPTDTKYQELKCENKHIRSKILERPGGLDIMHLLGFENTSIQGIKFLVLNGESIHVLSDSFCWIK